MKASETSLFKFLEGNKQFVIPIYQRLYSWNREQCEQLWNDIVRAATKPDVNAHFVGSIVYIQHGLYQSTGIAQLLVIDGQQRLTTLTLLLAAMVQAIQMGEVPATVKTAKIVNSYLMNQDEERDDRYKLILTQQDKATLLALVAQLEPPAQPSPLLVQNYAYFREQIQRCGLDPQVIYAGLGKLMLVDIALDRDHDNPQLIFESLNSTGMDLSQADLIRNYILMRLEPKHQTKLYEQHWFPMEQLFGPQRYADYFDLFVRDYLTVKMHVIPRKDTVYKVFKTYREETLPATTIDDLVADLHQFAKLYARLVFDAEDDAELREAIKDLDDLDVVVAYPMLLEAYHDYCADRLAKADLLAIIRLVESYVFRRAICEIPSFSMNKTFATLLRDVDKGDYLASVERAFMGMGSYKRFPRDDEFRRSLETKDVYHFQRRNYLLRKLENAGRKERVIVESLTIEHILPQNSTLSAAWQADLGRGWQDVQQRYLHTLGNLTLTGYNSELSDHSFAEKRDMDGGFRQSPLFLNADLGQLTRWDEATIRQRAARLAERALAVWRIPADEVRPEQQQTHSRGFSLADYEAVLPTEPLRTLFHDLRLRILNLDAEVYEIYYKYGIGFRIPDQFAWLTPQTRELKIEFTARPGKVDDPEHWLTVKPKYGDATRRWMSFKIASPAQIDYALYLIEQSLLLRRDSEAGDDDDLPASDAAE